MNDGDHPGDPNYDPEVLWTPGSLRDDFEERRKVWWDFYNRRKRREELERSLENIERAGL